MRTAPAGGNSLLFKNLLVLLYEAPSTSIENVDIGSAAASWKTSTLAPEGFLIEKFPLTSVAVPMDVRFHVTVTPEIGVPSAASFTVLKQNRFH